MFVAARVPAAACGIRISVAVWDRDKVMQLFPNREAVVYLGRSRY